MVLLPSDIARLRHAPKDAKPATNGRKLPKRGNILVNNK
jgi:hypothetical protein